MTRARGLAALLVVGLGSIALAAAQQPAGGRGTAQAPRVVEVEKLRDNLFVLKGGGGNTAVFVQADGITVVDTKNPGWGQPILDAIKELSPKPVMRIINTHTHGDHVSGNVEFPATIDVVTHENTKANMDRMAAPPAAGSPGASAPPSVFQASGGRGLPKRTFRDRLTIGAGADRIDLYYFGAGHTNGDAFVVFPAARAMHAGDIFSGKNLPLLDVNNGGSGLAIGDTLGRAHAAIQNVDAIITGHSTVMTWADLRQYADFNNEFRDAVLAAKKAGRSIDDIAGSWTIPAKYAGYAAPQAARLRSNVQVVYDAR